MKYVQGLRRSRYRQNLSCLLGHSPSVSLSAMSGLSEPSVSGLVTTIDVRGVTKLYSRDISRALAEALVFSSLAPLLLRDRIDKYILNIQISKHFQF